MRGWFSPLRVLGALAVLLLVTAITLNRMQSGDYILSPDVAHPVAPLVHVAKKVPRTDTGTLYFVDVRLAPATELDKFVRWLGFDAHSSLVPADEILPPGSNNQKFIHTELRQMSQSQRIAAAVALRQLHYANVIKPTGVRVDAIARGTDAAGKLKPRDLIIAVNGVSTLTTTKLRSVLATVKPGQVVTLRIKRGAQTLVESIKTVGLKGRALVGFAPSQAALIKKLPFKVSIDAGDIGGPSAGLAFTLEVMQQLGANVTHGYNVAATGEINVDGTVGPIGGVEQKTWGVREAGAQVFLVPVGGGNVSDARANAGPDLKIIPVTSLAQALHALAALPKLK